jgi:hypothetical protein
MHENCTLPTFELCVQEVIGRPPGRRPGSRAASESASTTEGMLSHAASLLSGKRDILQGPAVVGSRSRARPIAGLLVSMRAQPAGGF